MKTGSSLAYLAVGGLGALAGVVGSRLLAADQITPSIDAEAARIWAFDTLSQVYLRRKALYCYTHQGQRAGLYAWTITVGDGDTEGDNPQCLMSVTPQENGTTNYEFGGHGPPIDIYCDGVLKLTVPVSVGFTA